MANPFGKQRLEELEQDQSLELPDWDSYGAKPITREALARVRSVLDALDPAVVAATHIVPTGRGGLELEWRNAAGNFTIEVREKTDVATLIQRISAGVASLGLITP